MSKLWGGRFKEEQDPLFKRFNASFSFDYVLFDADITGSVAYAEALAKVGILNEDEKKKLCSSLLELKTNVKAEPEKYDFEDVHSFVETKLSELCGSLAKKLHTGRSRNDQVSTDLRLFLRGKIDEIQGSLKNLSECLVEHAEKNFDVAIPGYTHLQRAQPVLWSHYMLSFFEMFARDSGRLAQVRARTNILPLGSGALSGNSFGVDREFLAKQLGFEAITKNSLDATSDRDFVIEFLNAASISMIHLSRMAEDLIIYASAEFALVDLSDKTSTGSSLMPQKKNPDSLELIRGKVGRVFGHQIALQTTMKAMPSAYNKDLQEDKEALFDTVATLKDCLDMMRIVISNLKVNKENAAKAAKGGFMNATELADYLAKKGMPFREAHHLLGEIVLFANENKKNLGELSLTELKKFSPLIENDVYERLALTTTLESKKSFGGTAPARVAEAIKQARAQLSKMTAK